MDKVGGHNYQQFQQTKKQTNDKTVNLRMDLINKRINERPKYEQKKSEIR